LARHHARSCRQRRLASNVFRNVHGRGGSRFAGDDLPGGREHHPDLNAGANRYHRANCTGGLAERFPDDQNVGSEAAA
jgi:hypothetical protein